MYLPGQVVVVNKPDGQTFCALFAGTDYRDEKAKAVLVKRGGKGIVVGSADKDNLSPVLREAKDKQVVFYGQYTCKSNFSGEKFLMTLSNNQTKTNNITKFLSDCEDKGYHLPF